MRPLDELVIQHVLYKSGHLHIGADILRKPYLSPYIDSPRYEPHVTAHDEGFFKREHDVEKKESDTPLTPPSSSSQMLQ